MSQKVSVKKKLLKTICMPGRLGPENRRNFLWRRNFFGGYCTTGFGEGEWFDIYVRQAHSQEIPVKFDNMSYTEMNIKKSMLYAS